MPKEPSVPDPSNGYDALAEEFMARRQASIGGATVRTWSRELPRGAAVLDLGCGHGVPVSQVLIEGGFHVHGVDASPKMVAAYRRGFPRAPVACEAVEDSSFFGRTFEGIVACGLLFLLSAEVQSAILRKVASALNPGGRFLFTSPERACVWTDALTGAASLSLGAPAYRAILLDSGVELVGQCRDEGDNHYYSCRLPMHA